MSTFLNALTMQRNSEKHCKWGYGKTKIRRLYWKENVLFSDVNTKYWDDFRHRYG